MSASRPPANPYYRNQPPAGGRTAPGVLSQAEWSELVAKQRMDRVVPKSEGSVLSGIQLRPKNVRFATQNKGEKVFILLRRHFVTNVGWISSSLFYALIPVILWLVLSNIGVNITFANSDRIIIITILFYYSVLFTSTIRHFVDWYFNMYLVTNERVVDFDFKTFSSRGASESSLANIEDVKEVSVGVLPSFFNYGDVSIFSAADKNVITFHSIPRPTFVRDKISDLSDILIDNRGH